jgi:hypothetical protein
MGSQGEIYVVYGVVVETKVLYEPKADENPVIYSINGHGVFDEDDEVGVLDQIAFEVEHYNGIPTQFYGPSVMDDTELVIRVLGHSRRYGGGDMGARHVTEGFGSNVGKMGKALVGYVACCECYINGASKLPLMWEIEAEGPRLVSEIKEKLGLDIKIEELGLHLLFDAMQGI